MEPGDSKRLVRGAMARIREEHTVTEPEIRPRIDEDGGWCDDGCPVFHWANQGETVVLCELTGNRYMIDENPPCPIYIKRMAALLRRCRSLMTGHVNPDTGIFDDIDALLGGE
jgi:hypothetical protein